MAQTYKTVEKRGANHALHLVLSIFTAGIWIPFWIIAAMKGRKTVTRTPLPQYSEQPGFRPPYVPPAA